MSKAASDLQCPVCGQDAEGRRAVKRVRKWLQDSRLDRFMFDKLMQVVKAQMGMPLVQTPEEEKERLMQQAMAGGTFKWNALDPDRKPGEEIATRSEQFAASSEERSPKTARRWAKDKLRDKAGEDLPQQIKQELWGDEKPPAPQFKEVQPVTLSPKAQKLQQVQDADTDADWALNYAEKKNEKLAKDREYQRKYYHANKERIERLRKARAGRVSSRRNSNTGAKANGH